MNASWFSIKKEEKDDCEIELNKKIEELSIENKNMNSTIEDMSLTIEDMSSKMEDMSSTIQGMSSTIEDMSSKMEDMSSTIQGMSSTIQGMSSVIDTLKHKFSIIEVENLKLINRILEAEISLERTKNILVRKHISFPFISTLLSNRFL